MLTVRMGPLGRKESKAPLALMEMMGLMALKGHKEFKELLALTETMAQPAHRGHKALPELLAHRVQPLFIQTLRSLS